MNSLARIKLDAIPSELKSLPNWVLWKYGGVRANGKRAKVPYTGQGTYASVSDSATFASFDSVSRAVDNFDGIGFVFVRDSGYAGIDLDGCVSESGALHPTARHIIDKLGSYSELSPSGNGLHIIVKCTLPPDICHRAQIEGIGIEVYDSARYFTMTGDHLEGSPNVVTAQQLALNDLIARFLVVDPTGGGLAPSKGATARSQPCGDVDESSDSDIVDTLAARPNGRGAAFRALFYDGDMSAYNNDHSSADLALANMIASECADEPQRVDRVFRRSLLMRAKWDDRHYADGRTYGEETVRKACAAAEEENDLDNAFRLAPPKAPVRPKLREEALIGIAGNVVRIIGDRSEGDPCAILTTFLAAFGNAVGTRPGFRIGAVKHTARIFLVHVGETASGRKGQGYDDGAYVVRKADPEWHDEAFVNGLGSGEGLLQKLADVDAPKQAKKTDSCAGETINIDQLRPSVGCRAFLYEPELSRLLSVSSREGSTLSPIVRTAWDQNRLELRVRKLSLVVTNSHVSIVAQTTPNELQARLTELEVANGFANRFLFVSVHRSKSLPYGGNFDCPEVANLILIVRAAIRAAQSIGDLAFDKEARTEWERFYREMSGRQRIGLTGALLARAEAHVLRLAVVYALLDGVPTIAVPHLCAAQALWDYCEQSARFIFGDALGDDVAQRLLDEVRAIYPQGLSRDKQHNLFGRHVPAARIRTARENLVRQGLAGLRRRLTPGRTSEELFALLDPGENSGESEKSN